MTSPAPLATRLAQVLERDQAGKPLPQRICLAAKALTHADGAAITVENSAPTRVTLCSTDRRADLIEDLQDVLGEGPGTDAYNFGQPVETGLAGGGPAHRWPSFVPAAEKILGHRAWLWAYPLRSASQVIGTISFYRLTGTVLAEPATAIQSLAESTAAKLLTDPLAFSEVPDADGWSARAVVHQATGILIAKLGVGASEALALLRSYAFFAGTSLGEVAADVVDHKLDLADS